MLNNAGKLYRFDRPENIGLSEKESYSIKIILQVV